jgi:DNA polymerase-3 subunit delta'
LHYLTVVPLTPLIGHRALRTRLNAQVARGSLAASILFTGPAGIGKQRLALWLGQRLLCDVPTADGPCGICTQCKYVLDGVHPDLLWIFPREGMKNRDPSLEDVAHDVAEGVAERLADGGIYPRPDGSCGIFVHAARLMVHRAAHSPAMARRKVIVVGDAERMTPQASSQEAANAFLKLLEEPPADTTIILTSSEPGALLPTIRSRVIQMRVRPLGDDEVREFLGLPATEAMRKDRTIPDLVRAMQGAPGSLGDADARTAALKRATAMLDAVTRDHDRLYRVAYVQGSAKARGPFTDALDALSELLHQRARDATDAGDARTAANCSRAMVHVEEAKRDADRNAVPQLVTYTLLANLADTL